MPLKVIKDTFDAEKDNLHGKIPLRFIVLVILIPLTISYILVSKKILLNDKSISTLMNVLAIFIGFLIAALVPYFEIAASALGSIDRTPKDQAEDIPWQIENRRKLFRIIFPSIVQSIVVALLTLAFLIFLSLLTDDSGKVVENRWMMILNGVIYFLLSSSFFSVFNLVKRMSVLVIPIIKNQSN